MNTYISKLKSKIHYEYDESKLLTNTSFKTSKSKLTSKKNNTKHTHNSTYKKLHLHQNETNIPFPEIKKTNKFISQ